MGSINIIISLTVALAIRVYYYSLKDLTASYKVFLVDKELGKVNTKRVIKFETILSLVTLFFAIM